MRWISVGAGLLFALMGATLLGFAPDTLSLLFIVIMSITVLLGFMFGMIPLMDYAYAFRHARDNIMRAQDVQTSSVWIAVKQIEFFFHQNVLDRMFTNYAEKVDVQQEEGVILSDIEEVINEDSLALHSWQNAVNQIPGALTAVGLLGTFIGFVVGISNIGFSSVEAALSSIELLLGGIDTAFYTSIVGVIYSVLFNIIHKLMWNIMQREMGLFVEDFHLHVLPSVEEQTRQRQHKEMQLILERLDRIPRDRGFSMAAGGAAAAAGNTGNEMRLMPEIRAGLQAGEFTFFIQPKCDLNTRQIVGGEALVRWRHNKLGLISPAEFLPVVERNGFIVRIDCYIWEEVCKTIRRWIDSGVRPVPLAVNISKTDVLAMDTAGFLIQLVHKYHIPPRYLELEIAENAYLESEASVAEVEEALRQNGFRVIVDGFHGDFVALSVLNTTRVDALKMDLRFLESKKGKEIDAAMAVLAQARKLNFPIMAEGIETAEMLTALRRGGCTRGQGYYLHRPMQIKEFEELMKQG